MPKPPSVPMEQALSPAECEKMREFLRVLATCAKKVPAGQKLDLGSFMIAWREMHGSQPVKNAWCGKLKWTEDKARLAELMKKKGMTQKEIAAALGVCEDTVHRRLRAGGE